MKKGQTDKTTIDKKEALDEARMEYRRIWAEVEPFVKKTTTTRTSTTGSWRVVESDS